MNRSFPLQLSKNLPEASASTSSTKSSLRFALLRAWLQRCDEEHRCYRHHRALKEKFPTRVLDLSNSDALRLVSSQEVFSQEVSSQRYIALSHCWGKLTPGEIPQHCTTLQNIGLRKEGSGFCVGRLPRTFRDAIEVSQSLGVRYLWIDSLCIIQGSKEDWATESKRMEDVYAGAYCTIAATSAASSEAGFLEHNISNQYMYVSDNESPSSQAYSRTRTANFVQEVDNAPLNLRAWVLQERCLSRRIVHFSSQRMYFECGYGIYDEDYTQMKRYEPKTFFSLAPFNLNFPSSLASWVLRSSSTSIQISHIVFTFTIPTMLPSSYRIFSRNSPLADSQSQLIDLLHYPGFWLALDQL